MGWIACGRFALLAGVWTVVIVLIMWPLRPHPVVLDLASPLIEGAAFAVGAALFALADPGRPRFLRWRPNSRAAIAYLVIRFRRHLCRVAAMLVGFAGVLETGQCFETRPRFSVFEFGENALWILGASAAVYGPARLYLGCTSRITRRYLGRVADAFPAEAMYSAYLRDVIQAGRAIYIAPSIDAADKIERLGRLLDQAVGVEMPNPREELLDTVFGAGSMVPAAFRPSVERAEPPTPLSPGR